MPFVIPSRSGCNMTFSDLAKKKPETLGIFPYEPRKLFPPGNQQHGKMIENPNIFCKNCLLHCEIFLFVRT